MGIFDFLSQSEKKNTGSTDKQATSRSGPQTADELRRGTEAISSGDAAAAIAIFHPLAEAGNAEAQCRLALVYKVALQDYRLAAEWYKKAADQGHAEAQAKLGFLYKSGRGVEKNLEEGALLYERAANQGYAEAQYNLGRCYLTGEGKLRDVSAALKWFSRAAESGYTDAEYTLGVLFAQGTDVDRDPNKAIYWLTRAAEKATTRPTTVGDLFASAGDLRNGGINALWNLGLLYRKGDLVSKDVARSFRYFLKAAQLGDAASQHAVGVSYINGEGIAVDTTLGIEYLRKAALQGYEKAQQALQQLSR